MELPRRAFLHLTAGAAALPLGSRIASAQNQPTQKPSEQPVRPLAERLAAYADGLRYDDIDAATVERVNTHVIDTIGCGIGAFDERPVFAATSRWRLAVTQPLSAPIGARHRSWLRSPTAPLSATSISMTPMWDAFPLIRAIILRHASRWRRRSGRAHRS